MATSFVLTLAIVLMINVRAFNNLKGTVRWVSKATSKVTARFAENGRVSASVLQDASNASTPKGKMDLAPPKGTRDFFPEDQRLKTWLFSKWREVAASFGYEEYDAPILESEELYTRKAGDEVTQQLYNFEDKGGRKLSLRPEMTPSLARMVLSKKNALSFPLKWFSIPQCWRYERMTRGRRREHYQWNMDVWGVEGVEAEAELLSAVVTFFKSIGITAQDVGIKVNSRKLLTSLMRSYGIEEDKWASACVLIDKLDKVQSVQAIFDPCSFENTGNVILGQVPLSALQSDFKALGLEESVVESLVECLQMKDIESFTAKLGSESEGVADVSRLLQLADAYGIREWLVFDASVVRGLSYYTGIVFEGFDRSGELRAICGGGRYDTLLTSFGGQPVCAAGFGFGDAVIVELLKMKNLLPDTTKSDIEVVVYAMESSLSTKAVAMATALRQEGLKVDLVLDERKTKWVFQRADKVGAEVVVLFGVDEAARGEAVVKFLRTSKQISCPEIDVAKMIKNRNEN